MKIYFKTIITLFAITLLLMPLTSCTKSGDDTSGVSNNSSNTSGATNTSDTSDTIESETDPNAEIFIIPEGNGISFEEEEETAIIETVDANIMRYYGKWATTSDKAVYLYDNFEVDISPDGTWTAIITDENLNGTWEDKGDYLHMDNDIFSFDVAFEKSGKLMLIETTPSGKLYSVLTKK